MALQLDIEPAVEQRFQTLELVGRGRHLTRRQQAADAAADAADQGQQALGIALQLGEGKRRQRAGLELEMGAAHQPHQVEVARLVLHQQGQPVGRRGLARRCDAALFLAADAEIAADDRLNTGLGRILGELQGAEKVVAVGDGDRRHGVRLGERHDLSTLFAPSVSE